MAIDFSRSEKGVAKYRGVLYILMALTAFFIGVEYQTPELLKDPLFIMLPFGLGIIITFMTLTDETTKSSAIFGFLIILTAVISFAYSVAQRFFSKHGIILMYGVILMVYAGVVLLVAARRIKKT